jgi:GT2 family glycosyltransferase
MTTPAPGDCAISVVVVNWNGGDLVVDCLRSLHDCPPSLPWEAILVDNASSDDSVARIRAELPGVRVIANARNVRLAAGTNQGMRASHAPFGLISNPDVVYSPGAVDALYELMTRRPRAAFAIARLRDPDGTIQVGAGDLPKLREALLGRAVPKALAKTPFARLGRPGSQNDRTGFWWYDWAHDSEQSIGHGGEACYLVRRAAVDEIGLQDEGFVLDWEGIEWSRRAVGAGWEIWYCPQADVLHMGGVSVRQVPFRWVVSTHRGMYRYFRGQLSPVARPFAAAAIGLRAGTKLLVAAVDSRLYDRAH